MKTAPVSNDFVVLALTLIRQLPSSASDSPDVDVLLRLQTIFGSMLMSALQLLDRHEVQHVFLPTGRRVWQVGSSTGAPYTIQLSLPPVPTQPPVTKVAPTETSSGDNTGGDNGSASTGEPSRGEDGDSQAAAMTDKALDKREHGHGPEEQSYIRNTLDSLQGLYCPCTGFAYNSLVGDRNLFVRSSTSLSSRADQKCKHLLAVLLANQMGRAYKMEVAMHNVAGLLDLAKAAEVKPAEAVKVERVDEDMETDA